MTPLKKKLISKKGQASFELIILVTSASLVAIVIAYFFIISSKNIGYGINESGKKAKSFINVTDTKSSKYVDSLNTSI